jgi:hypothetical protein
MTHTGWSTFLAYPDRKRSLDRGTPARRATYSREPFVGVPLLNSIRRSNCDLPNIDLFRGKRPGQRPKESSRCLSHVGVKGSPPGVVVLQPL